MVPLVSIPMVSRRLDPEGLGRAGFFDSYSYYFMVLAEMGIMVYATRKIATIKDQPAALGKFVSEVFSIHVISTFLIGLIYLALSFTIPADIFEWPLYWSALLYFVLNAFACEWYFIGTEQFRFIALRVIFVRLAALAAIWWLVQTKDDYIIYYFIIAGSGIANILFNVGLMLTQVRLTLRSLNLRQHIPFLWVMYGISVVHGISLFMDNVLLGWVSTAAAVGIYSLAMKVIKLTTALITDSLLVFFPRIVQSRQTGNSRQLLLRNFQWISFVGMPAMLGIIVFATDIVRVLLGDQYGAVVLPLRGLALFGIFRIYMLYYSKQYLMAFENEKAYFNALLIGNIVLVISALVGGYFWAEKGAVAAIVLSEALTLLFVVLYCSRYHDDLVFDKNILNNTIVSSLSFYLVHSVVHSLPLPGFIVLFGGILFSGITYLAIMHFMLKDSFTQFLWQQCRELLKWR